MGVRPRASQRVHAHESIHMDVYVYECVACREWQWYIWFANYYADDGEVRARDILNLLPLAGSRHVDIALSNEHVISSSLPLRHLSARIRRPVSSRASSGILEYRASCIDESLEFFCKLIVRSFFENIPGASGTQCSISFFFLLIEARFAFCNHEISLFFQNTMLHFYFRSVYLLCLSRSNLFVLFAISSFLRAATVIY